MIKGLEFSEDDVKTFAECFGIVHHSRGWIRLWASEKLVSLLLKGDTQRLQSLLESESPTHSQNHENKQAHRLRDDII